VAQKGGKESRGEALRIGPIRRRGIAKGLKSKRAVKGNSANNKGEKGGAVGEKMRDQVRRFRIAFMERAL